MRQRFPSVRAELRSSDGHAPGSSITATGTASHQRAVRMRPGTIRAQKPRAMPMPLRMPVPSTAPSFEKPLRRISPRVGRSPPLRCSNTP
jgi:hypothetical protein